MTLPDLGSALRHRGPALLLERIDEFDGATLACVARDDGPWPWPRVLEAGAQAAGLLAGLQPGGLPSRAVVAEYTGILVRTAAYAGTVRVVARLERRVLHFWRCRIAAHGADGDTLLEGTITLAADR